MKGYKSSIEYEAVVNTDFRRVLYTSENSQLVLMNLRPAEETGLETHRDNDQFFCVEQGYGKCIIDGYEYGLTDGDAVLVPKGSRHNFINLSDTEDLKLYTIYSPPHHKDGLVRATKKSAEMNEEEFDGRTTEDLSNREDDHVYAETSREQFSFFSPVDGATAKRS